MPALDSKVLEHLGGRLFTPERLTTILQAYVTRTAANDKNRAEQLAQAKRALTEAEGRIDRLLQMVEQGLMSLDDTALKERVGNAKAARQAASERVQLLSQNRAINSNAITPDKIERFARALREALANPDNGFRKAYLKLFVDQVIVGDSEINLSGPTAPLAKGASTGRLPVASSVVPSFVQDWRPVRDSNPCYRRERAVSWASRRTGRGGSG